MKQTNKGEKFGSDVLADLVKAMGIEYVPLNPGASVRGIHDSFVNYGGNRKPELILCCHEEIAVAIASGYFRATGKPLLVLLHDLEGLFHATKAIFDAWIQKDAMILVGGNGPMDIEKRRPWIDWIHTALVPGLAVRDYVKWDDQPQGLRSAVESFIRAYRIASAPPEGPVYIALDVDLQEEPLKENFKIPSLEVYPAASFGEGSLEDLGRVSKMLVEAKQPAIIVERYGIDDEAVGNLVTLAEETGSAIIDNGARFNFPSDHPLNLSGAREEILEQADLVLALAVTDLYHAVTKEESHFLRKVRRILKPECQLIRIDLQSVNTRSWISDYGRLAPATMVVVAHAPAAVAKLVTLCRNEKLASTTKQNIKDRVSSLKEWHQSLRKQWMEEAHSSRNQKPLSLASLAMLTWELSKNRDWVLSFPGYTSGGINMWIRRIWDIKRHYQYPGRGGGTGTGIGAAIGAALANRGKLCLDFQPDGDLLYTASSLWTAAHHRIPLLVIMQNNRSYYNDEEHQRSIAIQRNRSVENRVIGIRLEDPNVDFAKMAESYGLVGFGPVDSAEAFEHSFRDGLKVVMEDHRPCVIDSLVQTH